MKTSLWDLRYLPEFRRATNLQCLIKSTIPSVRTTLLPKPIPDGSATPNEKNNDEKDEKVEAFMLKDFWHCYRDWSAYGVGIPIMLKNGDAIAQYYFPSLSAMQIFTIKPQVDKTPPESDNDDIMSKTTESKTETSFGSSSADQEAVLYDFGELYCQYNEIVNPYGRVPLTEKIKELAKKYPGLTTFKSTELSPHSWVAIAWYPVYHIPVATKLKDLSAAFVTYHSLSLSSEGVVSAVLKDCQGKDQVIKIQNKFRKSKTSGYRSMSPFAMTTYKMVGEFWIDPETCDHEMITTNQRAAWQWLKHHSFHHHDFEFFISRSN